MFPQLDKPDPDEVQPIEETLIASTAHSVVFPTLKTSIEYSIVQPDGETPFEGDEWREALRKTAQEFQRRLEGEMIAGHAPIKPTFAIKRELKFEMPDDAIDELNRQVMHDLLFAPGRWRRAYGGIYGDDGRLHYAVTVPPIS